MDPTSLRVMQNACLSLLKDAKWLLLSTFCDPTAGIVKWDRTDGTDTVRTDRREGWNNYVDLTPKILKALHSMKVHDCHHPNGQEEEAIRRIEVKLFFPSMIVIKQ